jgi:tRNA nucleotidyltransferase (CCA-adding enzyme)
MGQALHERMADGGAASEQAYERRSDGADVLAGLRELPGGRELLDLASERDDVELVGGAVRDLLLGRGPHELDVVVGDEDSSFARDAALFAQDLLARLDTEAGVDEHERFGTALVEWDGGRIDIATRRAESYAAPGALPDVRAGTEEEDLERRDFTINAIAVPLGGPHKGKLRQPRHLPAREDLERGCLRVLHKHSFSDDPTRLLRLARYAARLRFEVEENTAALAGEALAARALDTVSGARIGAELRLALSEPDAPAALAALRELGVLAALHPRLRFEEPMAREALALLPEDGRPDLALLAALMLPLALRTTDPRAEIVALLDRWETPAGDRDRVTAAAVAVERLVEELPKAERASALRATARDVPLEGVALAGALEGGAGKRAWGGKVPVRTLERGAAAGRIEGGEPADLQGRDEEPPVHRAARRWLMQTRHVRLEITGDDLLAAGIPAGPEIGRRLEAVLDLRLDGQIPADAQAQLAVALQA